MEAFARAPDPLPNKQPMDKTWRMWKQEFEIFLKAAGFDAKSSDMKAVFLMNKIGKFGLEAMQDMHFENEEDKQDYDILLNKFDEHFDPPKREIEERYKFYSRSKKNNEPIEAYVADLKEKAKTCNFGDLTDSLVRDMVILDIKDKTLRKLMFEEKNLDINKLIFMYRQYEINNEKMKEVTQKVTSEITDAKSNLSSGKKSSNPCSKCGTTHQPRDCPAFNVVCDKCKEKGHFTQKCGKKNPANKNVNVNKNTNKGKNVTKNPFDQIAKN